MFRLIISRTRESKLTYGKRVSVKADGPRGSSETNLSGRKNRYKVVIYEACLLFDLVRVRFLFQVLTRLPEHDVLLTVLAFEEVAKHFATN